MRALKRQPNTPNFIPDYTARSLQDIDFNLLKKHGVRYIAFDADSTLVRYKGKSLPEETKRFLILKRRLFKNWCIASNRITNDLLPLGEEIDAAVIRATLFARKPQKRFFKRVLTLFKAKPEQVAMIGDKLIADMYGAKRVGMVTVWVEKIGPDSLHDRLLHVRSLEKWLIKRYPI